MARFIDKAEFINQNVAMADKRITSQYSKFLEQKPTFTTYYHINTRRSTTDKGLKDVEGLIDSRSPIRYNKIHEFPLYGIEQIQLDLSEEEEGLNTNYEGNAVILPNTIHPLQDDYFVIDYLGKRALFRITDIKYDTIKSNGYYNIAFMLRAVDDPTEVDKIDCLVVEEYDCLFENIGTGDNCLIASRDAQVVAQCKELFDRLKNTYMEKYYYQKYNALLFMVSSDNILYDYSVARFINRSQIFFDRKTTETIYVYEEERQVNNTEYENSVYDRIIHKDFEDWEQLLAYFNIETSFMLCEGSIFDYYRDLRIKYMQFFDYPLGPFNNAYYKYIDTDFIQAIDYKDPSKVPLTEHPWEGFVYHFAMTDDCRSLISLLEYIDKRRIPYNLETFVFIPLVLYALRQLINQIINDNKKRESIQEVRMDQPIIRENT